MRAKDPDIVDEDVACRLGLHEGIAAGGDGKISDDSAHLGHWYGHPHGSQGSIHGALFRPVEDDRRAAIRKPAGDRKADPAGRAGDDRNLVRKIYLHGASLRLRIIRPAPHLAADSPRCRDRRAKS